MNKSDQHRATSDIQNRIDEVRQSQGDADQPSDASSKAIGIRIGIDLFSGVVFGVIVGLALDRWLGTAPWLMIVFIVLGTAAGILNVIRTAKEEEKKSKNRTTTGR